MCGIFGFLRNPRNQLKPNLKAHTAVMNFIMQRSRDRGRDGIGFLELPDRHPPMHVRKLLHDANITYAPDGLPVVVIGNVRAEPTTEYIADKDLPDQQPYSGKGWSIVHNGTIANDAELRDHTYRSKIDSAAILEQVVAMSEMATPYPFEAAIKELKGSFAILAVDRRNVVPDPINRAKMFFACNYRPIWYATRPEGTYFASDRSFFPPGAEWAPKMIPPYSMGEIRYDYDGGLDINSVSLYPPRVGKSLVVCSGGLDSVVAATQRVRAGRDVTLIHFEYGSRAEGPEILAVQAAGAALGVPVVRYPLPIYRPSDSPLLQADSAIAGGEAGAEFAHEWVPARNLVLLAVATAYAEANGFDEIVLGNNMEEAGAYPDNEPEFIHKFNDILPFATGAYKGMNVTMPVGGMMKREIVALGHEIGAPMDVTWSCYRAGEKHCGKCGPCFMRKTAFEINNLPEVIEYEND